MDEGRYLDVEAAARYLTFSVSYVQKLTCRRRLPYLKVGRRCLYDRVLLDKWLSRRQVLPRDWGS